MAILGGGNHGRGSVIPGLVHVGAEGRKETDGVLVAILGGTIQGRGSVLLIRKTRIRTSCNEPFHLFKFAIKGIVPQFCVLLCLRQVAVLGPRCCRDVSLTRLGLSRRRCCFLTRCFSFHFYLLPFVTVNPLSNGQGILQR